MASESKLYCPECGSLMTKAGHPEMGRPKPGRENTKQNYKCTNKLCRRKTVNPVMVENKAGGS